MTFESLNLIDPLLRAVQAEGYTAPTPIQVQAIPYVLEGRDVLGCAQTGTGKTAAFALPILQRLVTKVRGPNPPGSGRRPIRVLVLTPTRELASQIADSFATYGRLIPQHRVDGVALKEIRHTVIFGGVGQRPQSDALRAGVDVVIATPGRFLDLQQQGFIDLQRLEVFVLDEADRMLDMGFLPDVRRVIAKLPALRQTLFFSATMPPDIRHLADSILRDPARVAVAPPATTVELIQQSVYFVEKSDKRSLLRRLLLEQGMSRALVFTRTKHGANRVVQELSRNGIEAEAIHGNKSQSARERALSSFKAGRLRVLVATDIASRGIDIDDVSHVINYEVPNIPETYVHRIGRTARAGASGIAISFCDQNEREFLRDIERLTRQRIPVVGPPPPGRPVPHPSLAQSGAARSSDRSQPGQGRERGHGQGQRPRSQPGRGRGHGHGQRPQARPPSAAAPQQTTTSAKPGGHSGAETGRPSSRSQRRSFRPRRGR